MSEPIYPSVCGHVGHIIVQYSSKEDPRLHTICKPCFDKEIYYVQEVVEPGVWFEGGHTVEIKL